MQSTGPAALIIGYRRHQNVKDLLTRCLLANVSKIYLSLDAAKGGDLAAQRDSELVKAVAHQFQQENPGLLTYYVRRTNVGCAVSVLSSLDWVFQSENEVIVLEDDCLPNPAFFTFVRAGLKEIQSQQNLWLVSGNQFAPESIFNDGWTTSTYPLIWGWATNRTKWDEMRASIRSEIASPKGPYLSRLNPDRVFWQTGARRCLNGFVDAWDILLATKMLENGKFSILPSRNLVSNRGSEDFATHTVIGNPLLNRNTEECAERRATPVFNKDVNSWLRKNVYGISFRHLFSTTIRDLLNIFKSPKFDTPLIQRWDSNKI